MDTRRQIIDDLRRQLEQLDGTRRKAKFLPFGIPAVDRHLPGGGIALGSLHEVLDGGIAAEFGSCATLFCAGIAARLKGPVIWCRSRKDMFAPGLALAGLSPDRVLHVAAPNEQDVLPLVEECAREKGLGAVIGEATKLSLTASRRIQLAAEESGIPVLIIRRWWTARQRELVKVPTVSATRWRISPVKSEEMPAQGLGRARWHVELLRCRGAETRSWFLEACDRNGRLDLTPQREWSGLGVCLSKQELPHVKTAAG